MTIPGVIAAGIPQITGDLDLLTDHALGLQTTGPALGQTGSDVHTTFQGLATCYRAPEAGNLFAATLPVRDIAVAVGEEIVTIGRALATYADTVRPLQTQLRDLQAQATALAATPPTDTTGAPDPAALFEQETALMREVNAAVAAWHEAQNICASTITALYGAPGYRPDNGDGRLDPGEFGFTAAQLDALTAAGQPLPWGTPTEVDQGFLGDLLTGWHGFAVDGFWADVTGLGSLIGFTPDGGHDRAVAGEAWGAIGNLTLIGYVDDMVNGQMNLFDATGAAYGAWGPVLGSLIPLDEFAHNPAGAWGQTIYNVGALPVAILKAAKPITAATRVTGGALSNAGRGVLDALTRMPTIDEILRTHADRLDLHPRFGAMPAVVGDGPGGHRFDVERPSAGPDARAENDVPSTDPASPDPGPVTSPAELGPEQRRELQARQDVLERQYGGDLAALRADPDHGGRATRSSTDESRVALDLIDRGVIPADSIRPPGPNQGDFYSPSTGLHYDLKGSLLPFPWVPSHDRPGRLGQQPPRVRVAMAMSASGLW